MTIPQIRPVPGPGYWRRVLARAARVVAGWLLLTVGLLLLIIPGPGTLLSLAGLSLLSREHEWARRWMVPWERRVRAGVRASVATRLALSGTLFLTLATVAAALLWSWEPAAPMWWPLAAHWWLPGGTVMGLGFGCSATAMVVTTVLALRARELAVECPRREGLTAQP